MRRVIGFTLGEFTRRLSASGGVDHPHPKFFASDAGYRGGHDYRRPVKHRRNQALLDCPPVAGKLVCLRGNDQARHPESVQPFLEFQVKIRGSESSVHEMDDHSNGRTYPKILFNQTAPLSACRLSGPGVTVARQVDQIKRTVKPVKIDTLSLARRGAGSGNAFSSCQPVDQAGFSYVRSSREDYLGHFPAREVLVRYGTRDEFCMHVCGMRRLSEPGRPIFRSVLEIIAVNPGRLGKY